MLGVLPMKPITTISLKSSLIKGHIPLSEPYSLVATPRREYGSKISKCSINAIVYGESKLFEGYANVNSLNHDLYILHVLPSK